MFKRFRAMTTSDPKRMFVDNIGAIRRMNQRDPATIGTQKRPGDDLLGYCEVHIEQGPVLEARSLPVGVVSAIAVYLYNVLSRRVLTMIAAIFRVIAYRAATGRVRAFIIVCHVKASLAHS